MTVPAANTKHWDNINLYNGGPTSKTLGRRCITVMQMFVFAGLQIGSNSQKLAGVTLSWNEMIEIQFGLDFSL